MKVFLIAALSADGFIARSTNELANWTSAEDKKLFVQLTKEAGIMVMGSTTLDTIGKALPGRRTIVYTTRPDQITVDGVEITADEPSILLDKLAKQGAETVAICGGRSIYTLFMKSGLVDELYLTIEPTVFGEGISLFSEPIESKFELLDSKLLNPNVILLHYSVLK